MGEAGLGKAERRERGREGGGGGGQREGKMWKKMTDKATTMTRN